MKSSAKSKKNLVKCLYCEQSFDVGASPKVGAFVYCDHCGEEFEIVEKNPVHIEWPNYEDEEDENEYDYEDEDYDYDDYDYDDNDDY